MNDPFLLFIARVQACEAKLGAKLGEVGKKAKERQERTGKSPACWLGPASSWDGSQVMFAAGNLAELSKPSNNILLERKGVAATAVPCSTLPPGEPSARSIASRCCTFESIIAVMPGYASPGVQRGTRARPFLFAS